MPSTKDIETLLHSSLSEFAQWLNEPPFWRARENECVNVFAHRFLASRRQSGGPLSDLTQIGIEVAVPQVVTPSAAGTYQKKDVRKDLVLWPRPYMHPFERESYREWRLSKNKADTTPAAILEWKVKTNKISPYDREWLEEFTRCYPDTLGVAVSVWFGAHGASLRAIAVRAGVTQEDWLAA